MLFPDIISYLNNKTPVSPGIMNNISLTIVSHDHSLMIQAHTQEYGNS